VVPNLHFGFNSQAAHNAGAFETSAVPDTWTKIAATFEVPPETARMNLDLFVDEGSGSIFIDDAALEKVSDSALLTPLLN